MPGFRSGKVPPEVVRGQILDVMRGNYDGILERMAGNTGMIVFVFSVVFVFLVLAALADGPHLGDALAQHVA